jgi:2-C-methyl-D-erythritol 4-phosphate cytidylyltransferase
MKSAIVLAGGKGVRFNGKKQYMEFYGKPMWKHVYDKAADMVDEIYVVGVDTPPGITRTQSVKNGLLQLSHKSGRVIILEAARPLVTKAQIETLLEDPYDSCTFTMPLVNTIIIDGYIYPDRSKCMSLLTPQAFTTSKLIEAYSKGSFQDMTDETRVMYEYFGIKPKLIPGGENLYKITYESDLETIKGIISRLGVKI